jgi:hypothetical protein
VDTFTKVKAAAAMAAPELTGWRLRDIRRFSATALGEAGVPDAVADAVLIHRQAATRGGVLGVHQRAQRWPEQVKAMEGWGAILAAAIGGCEPSDGSVASLRGPPPGDHPPWPKRRRCG